MVDLLDHPSIPVPDRLVFVLLAIMIGGAAGALVALLELAEGTSGEAAHMAVTASTVLIGSITFSGSVF